MAFILSHPAASRATTDESGEAPPPPSVTALASISRSGTEAADIPAITTLKSVFFLVCSAWWRARLAMLAGDWGNHAGCSQSVHPGMRRSSRAQRLTR